MSRPTRGHPRAASTFTYGAVTLFGRPSQAVQLVSSVPCRGPTTPPPKGTVWASPRSLAATDGVSVDFLSSGYLDVSVPRVALPYLCIQHGILAHDGKGVAPFGHLRIDARVQLPVAFRR